MSGRPSGFTDHNLKVPAWKPSLELCFKTVVLFQQRGGCAGNRMPFPKRVEMSDDEIYVAGKIQVGPPNRRNLGSGHANILRGGLLYQLNVVKEIFLGYQRSG